MRIITSMLRGTCVYYASTGNDGFGGRTFANGVEIDCRWEESRVLFINAEGKEETSAAVVYVPSDMAVGDYLYNGLASSVVLSADPQLNPLAKEIKGWEKLPTLRYDQYLRTCFLK